MKIDNFSWERWIWENFVIVVVMFFLIIMIIAGTISILHEPSKPIEVDDTDQPVLDNGREFNLDGVIAGTSWVRFSDKEGGELYVYVTPFGGVCEIEIGSDGSRRLFANYNDFTQEIKENSNGWISDSRICTRGKLIGYLYNSPPVFEKKCYLKNLPVEVQKIVLQTLYSRDLGKM